MNNIMFDSINNNKSDDEGNIEFDFYNKLLLLLKVKLKRNLFVDKEKIKKIIDGIKNNKYSTELLNYLYNYMYQEIDVNKIDLDIENDTLFIIEQKYDNKILYSTIKCMDDNLLKKQTINLYNEFGIIRTIKSISFCLESAIDLVILNTSDNKYKNGEIDDIITSEENNNYYTKIGFLDFDYSNNFPLYNVINLEDVNEQDNLFYSDHGLLQDEKYNYFLSSYTKTNLDNLYKLKKNDYLSHIFNYNDTFYYDQDIKKFISMITSEEDNMFDNKLK